LQQSERHIVAGERNLDLALTGRRATECELEILMLLDPGREQSSRPVDKQRSAAPSGREQNPRPIDEQRSAAPSPFDTLGSAAPSRAEPDPIADLPAGAALLAAARAVLLGELLPLLPAERRFDASLVGNCLLIAEREAAAAGAAASAREVALFYRPEGAMSGRDAGCPLAPDWGAQHAPGSTRTESSAAAATGLWRRFAGDLRIGAFVNSAERERAARTILWRLTIAKLRLANPRFIDANGIAWAGGLA
jgi:hypothetical protein